jgi:hypothetical protein
MRLFSLIFGGRREPPAESSEVVGPGEAEPCEEIIVRSAQRSDAPFELVTAAGAYAEKTWRELCGRPGVIPVLLGDNDTVDRTLEALSYNSDSFERIQEIGQGLDVRQWIEQRIEDEPEYYTFDMTTSGDAGVSPLFYPAYDVLTRKPRPEVFFGLIPVGSSWLVPAYLKIGGWNDCPDASVHVAFFRSWFERYGAEVVTVANDVVEFHVTRPPRTMEQAQELAREQYVYCTDIVEQGVGTVGNLAATLLGSDRWFFWWD